MNRAPPHALTFTALGALLLSACQASGPTDSASGEAPTGTPATAASEAPLPTSTSTPDGLTEADKGEPGARALLLDWARAIERRQFDRAWDLMSESDHQKWSKAEFAALFADLGEITVAVPGGSMEGAAGSLYYSEPVTITAPDTDGRPVRLEGEIVLRRVNGVPGATPEQLRWHVESTTLDWTH
jgi:hypothetical protein